MKRFEFRLQNLLQLKNRQKWLAELRQLQAFAQREAARALVSRRESQLGEAGAQIGSQVGHPLTAAECLRAREHSERIARALEAAQERERQAETQYQEACKLRTKIATEVESLATLREDRWQVYRQEVGNEAQDRLDEMTMQRWRQESANREAQLAEDVS